MAVVQVTNCTTKKKKLMVPRGFQLATPLPYLLPFSCMKKNSATAASDVSIAQQCGLANPLRYTVVGNRFVKAHQSPLISDRDNFQTHKLPRPNPKQTLKLPSTHCNVKRS